jgi:hypothetical protein
MRKGRPSVNLPNPKIKETVSSSKKIIWKLLAESEKDLPQTEGERVPLTLSDDKVIMVLKKGSSWYALGSSWSVLFYHFFPVL